MPCGTQGLDGDGVFPVPQLADVEVALLAVQPGLGPLPAQEDVAGCLHQPLPGDHPLAHVGVLAGSHEPAEHRRLGLLDLQEQRIGLVAAEHQHDPAAGPDAADADDLAGHVGVLVLLQQVPAVGFQRPPVLAEQVLDLRREGLLVHLLGQQVSDRDDQRRVGDDLWPAIDQAGQLGHFLHAVPGPRLGHALVDHLALPRFHLRVELRPQLVQVRVRVPDSQVRHRGEGPHRLPVAGDGGRDDLAAVLGAEPVAAGGYLHAGGQPLDVPFPRAGRRLIEVVDVEDQAALGGAEDAEVRQVRIPARLHRQPGHRSMGKVAGHRQRRAAVERERGDHHPAPPDRHQLRHPRLGLLLQQADRVGPARPRVEHRMAFPRHRGPRLLPPRSALRRSQPVQPRLQLVAVCTLCTLGRSPSCQNTHHWFLTFVGRHRLANARSGPPR